MRNLLSHELQVSLSPSIYQTRLWTWLNFFTAAVWSSWVQQGVCGGCSCDWHSPIHKDPEHRGIWNVPKQVTQRSEAGNGWGGRWRREAKATRVAPVPRPVPPEVCGP